MLFLLLLRSFVWTSCWSNYQQCEDVRIESGWCDSELFCMKYIIFFSFFESSESSSNDELNSGQDWRDFLSQLRRLHDDFRLFFSRFRLPKLYVCDNKKPSNHQQRLTFHNSNNTNEEKKIESSSYSHFHFAKLARLVRLQTQLNSNSHRCLNFIYIQFCFMVSGIVYSKLKPFFFLFLTARLLHKISLERNIIHGE